MPTSEHNYYCTKCFTTGNWNMLLKGCTNCKAINIGIIDDIDFVELFKECWK